MKKENPKKKPTFGKAPEKKNTGNFKPKFQTRKPNNAPKMDSDEIRLNKYISNSGVCSRREADIYIESGNVKVNGEVITSLGYKVKPTDSVIFDGTLLTQGKKEYYLLNKPKNFTTSGDESSPNHVYQLIKNASTADLKPIGRMDSTTTGLLVFTNDNDLVVKFSQPGQKSPKIYQVSLDRNLKYEDLEKISSGVTVDDYRIIVDEISYIEDSPKTEIGIKLRTPNVKVVRGIFEKFNYNVLKVDRVSFAGLTKKNLPRGNWRALTAQEVINLKNI